MFVFGDEAGRSRRFGLPAAVALSAIAGVAATALLWHPQSRSAPASVSSEAPPDPSSCTPVTLSGSFVEGGTVDARALSEEILEKDARSCEYLTAHDPGRSRLAATLPARSEAETINSGVTAAMCLDRLSCSEPRSTTTSDVALVRDALLRLGYPGADVRPAMYVGESPGDDIVYGVRLRTAEGCLVSFARMGQGAAPMGPVGTLPDGQCLHPGPQPIRAQPSGPIASLDCLRVGEPAACDEGG